MTQAFNLSQLANNLNTSGQLDATDGLTGAVPVANGGTGQTTYSNGQLLIGNGTGLTKANITAGSGIAITNGSGSITIATSGGGGVTSLNGETGAITNTTIGNIGSHIIAVTSNSAGGAGQYVVISANTTIAGSSLRYNFSTGLAGSNGLMTIYYQGGGGTSYGGGGTALSGTWRFLCYSTIFRDNCGNYSIWSPALLVRIS